MEKYTAIILDSRDVGEFDRIYTLYTKEVGMLRVIGRGVRKQTAKLAGHLEPGTLSEVYVARSRGMGQITSAITLENFRDLKKDFEKLSEILDVFRFFTRKFSEGEKEEKVFGLLNELLVNRDDLADRNESQGTMLIEAFWWKLFDFLGNRPETMKCSKCETRLGEAEKKFFSAERGGVVCEKCFANAADLSGMTNGQIKLLRIFLANSLSNILKVKAGGRELIGLKAIRKKFERFNF
jgi:DNA repair protein RecO (recombination protein O)